MPKRGQSRRYVVATTLRAPLTYAYRWCTHYTPDDGDLSGEGYERRILSRSDRRVVFEDLLDTRNGWIWIHREVRLGPPNGWHAESVGSDRRISVEYRLSALSDDRTQLVITALRQPYGIGKGNPPAAEWQRRISQNWARLGRVLERDYRRDRARRRKRRASGSATNTARV